MVESLLLELGISSSRSLIIYFDNLEATYIYVNPVFHSKMKHVALDYHFIRQKVNDGSLRITHISTLD